MEEKVINKEKAERNLAKALSKFSASLSDNSHVTPRAVHIPLDFDAKSYVEVKCKEKDWNLHYVDCRKTNSTIEFQNVMSIGCQEAEDKRLIILIDHLTEVGDSDVFNMVHGILGERRHTESYMYDIIITYTEDNDIKRNLVNRNLTGEVVYYQ